MARVTNHKQKAVSSPNQTLVLLPSEQDLKAAKYFEKGAARTFSLRFSNQQTREEKDAKPLSYSNW